MAEHDEVYGQERIRQLEAMLRELAERIQDLDERGELLASAAELQDRMGNLRSELFHYEVRSTYDTPEIAESRRIVEEAAEPPEFTEPNEDEDPWRRPPE
jgi:chromosome segregation ATPase